LSFTRIATDENALVNAPALASLTLGAPLAKMARVIASMGEARLEAAEENNTTAGKKAAMRLKRSLEELAVIIGRQLQALPRVIFWNFSKYPAFII